MSNPHYTAYSLNKSAEIRIDEAGAYIAITNESDGTLTHFGFDDADAALTFANKLAEAALLAEKQRMTLGNS